MIRVTAGIFLQRQLYTYLGQLVLPAQSGIVLMLQLVQLGSQLVFRLDGLGVSLDSGSVFL